MFLIIKVYKIYFSGNQNKKVEMGGEWGSNDGEEKHIQDLG
jgi:hypothetical protein